jgi:hypothetical protein
MAQTRMERLDPGSAMTSHAGRELKERQMKARNFVSTVALAAAVVFGAGSAWAGVPMWMGDYVWYDANGNGVQDDGADSGINGVRVMFYRDYDCNGAIDGYDEIYDYDFTDYDAAGDPGYYRVPAHSGWCFVAFLDPAYVPLGLVATTASELGFQTPEYDYWDVDFGLGVPKEEPDFACPKTIGFWKQQFTDKKSAKYSPAELQAIVARALELTEVFESYNDFPRFLNAKGNEGPLARATKQFAAFTLNLAAFELIGEVGFPAGLSDNEPLSLGALTSAGTVGEAYLQVEGYILSGASLELANDLADAINNGQGIAVDCEL